LDDSDTSDPHVSPSHSSASVSAHQHHTKYFSVKQRRCTYPLQRKKAKLNGKGAPSQAVAIPEITVEESVAVTSPSTEITGTSTRLSEESSPCDSQQSRQQLSDSDNYTIVIRLPDEDNGEDKPSIKMIKTDGSGDTYNSSEHIAMKELPKQQSTDSDCVEDRRTNITYTPSIGRRLTQTSDALRLGMQARINAHNSTKVRSTRFRKKRQEKKQEQKAAKTLSAILLAFIVTWTPYNLFTVIQTFCGCTIDANLYAIGKSFNLVYRIISHFH
jgi:phage tail sheath protein FI